MDAEDLKKLSIKKEEFINVKVEKGQMSPLERFYAIMDYKKPDRIIDTEFGYWKDTLKKWHSQGLPDYVDDNEKADTYFGFDTWKKQIPVNTLLEPPFEERTAEETDRYRIIYDEDNVKCKVFKDGTDTIPHYMEFPVKDRESYKALKERLRPGKERIKADLKDIAKKTKDRNYVLQVHAGSTAGMIRNWMGFDNFCMAIYDKPELLEEILYDLSSVSADIAINITEHDIKIDLVFWWEDIAYKNGPIVTPDFFNTNCAGAIKKVMDIYQKAGNRFGYVDCDGDFRKLMPGWLQSGVNIMFPLEVAAGIHPIDLRRDNPGTRMMGGVDKVVLTKGKDAIKDELKKLKPIVDEGGYIPHIDHRVQADVDYTDYLYYLEVKRDMFCIPNRVGEGK